MHAAPVVDARNLTKCFPGVRALDDVSVSLVAGRVHALMGENGAGKSTLMKLLAGLHVPDSGEIRMSGEPVHLRSPHDALRRGISTIHQELLPFPNLSVAENILMGREPAGWFPGTVDKAAMRREAATHLARLGCDIDPARRMRELSVAEMQTVEIAKALAYRARVILMDEPTSAISDREVEALFRLIGELKRDGVAIVYTSHKMDEVFRIADQVTVLRDGRVAGTSEIGNIDAAGLIRLMVGRELSAVFPRADSSPGEVALEVRGLHKRGRFRPTSFTVRRGEILGIAGLMGAGRTDLVSAIYGTAPADGGEILVRGRAVRIRKPADALANGIAMVTEDRRDIGLATALSVRHNITLASLRSYCRGPLIDAAAENAAANGMVRDLAIKTPSISRAVKTLSGGNQQKVVVANALLTAPDVLILDEPTRGIDIGAKTEIYALMRRLARDGKAIVMVSSEMPEILALSDRILVMRQGEAAAELDAAGATAEQILRHAMPLARTT